MSLVQSLAKVAVSVAAAKGIASVMNRVAQPTSRTNSRPGHEDHPNSGLGGKSQVAGFGSLLEQLGPAAAGGGSGSNAMARASAGNLDASISGLAQAAGAAKARTTRSTKTPHAGSFAEVLNQSFQKWDEPAIAPTPQQNAAAGLMLRAMLQAAKCDGRIDEGEKKKILDALRGASREDVAFVDRELSAPVDVQALARQVPRGLENQIYAVSVLGVDLDSRQEAEYLVELASALGMKAAEANAIHAKLGIPALHR